jgi:hypothetical protein
VRPGQWMHTQEMPGGSATQNVAWTVLESFLHFHIGLDLESVSQTAPNPNPPPPTLRRRRRR